jgi:hypothetical protein
MEPEFRKKTKELQNKSISKRTQVPLFAQGDGFV